MFREENNLNESSAPTVAVIQNAQSWLRYPDALLVILIHDHVLESFPWIRYVASKAPISSVLKMLWALLSPLSVAVVLMLNPGGLMVGICVKLRRRDSPSWPALISQLSLLLVKSLEWIVQKWFFWDQYGNAIALLSDFLGTKCHFQSWRKF